jgi:hypothetical protein
MANPMKVYVPLSASYGVAVSGAAGLQINQGGLHINEGPLSASTVALTGLLSSSAAISASELWLANGITIANGTVTSPSGSYTDLTVTGKLSVVGVMDVENRTDLHIVDKEIILASGSTDTSADGAGFKIQGAGVEFLWNSGSNVMTLNKGLTVTGVVSGSGLEINGNVKLGDADTDLIEVSGSLVVSGTNGQYDVASSLKTINDTLSGGSVVKSDKYTDLRIVLTQTVADFSTEDAVFHISGSQHITGLSASSQADLSNLLANVSVDVATRVNNTYSWLNDLVSVSVEPEENVGDSLYYPKVTVSAPALEGNSTVRLIMVNEKSGAINY